MVRLQLYNGSKTKEAWNPESPEFIDDWKPEECVIKAKAVQVTYGSHVNVYFANGQELYLGYDGEGFLEYEGVFYGDLIVESL